MKPVRAAAVALLLLVGCGEATTPDAAPTTSTSTTAPRPKIEPIGDLPSPRAGVERPSPDHLVHGQAGWGVYLAVARTTSGTGDVDTSAWDAAVAELEERGFPLEGDGGEIGCDGDPALEAFADVDADWGTAVYFLDRADADAYAASLDPAPRVVPVTYFCAD